MAENRGLKRSIQNKSKTFRMCFEKYVRGGSLTGFLNSHRLCTARAAHKLERGH
jgi:hypothetical protein